MSAIKIPTIDKSISITEFNDLKDKIENIEDHLLIYSDKSSKCSKCGHYPEINYDFLKKEFEENGYTFTKFENRKNCFKLNHPSFKDDYNYVIFQSAIVLECTKCYHKIRYLSKLLKKRTNNTKNLREIMDMNNLYCAWLFYFNCVKKPIEEILDDNSHVISKKYVIHNAIDGQCIVDDCGIWIFLKYIMLELDYMKSEFWHILLKLVNEYCVTEEKERKKEEKKRIREEKKKEININLY